MWTNARGTETCENCKYSEPKLPGNKTSFDLICRRNPPTPFFEYRESDKGQDTRLVHVSAHWPPVAKNDGCGEYATKAEQSI